MKKEHMILLVILALAGLFFLFSRTTGNVITSLNSCSDSDQGRDYASPGFVWGDFYAPQKFHYEKKDYCINEKYLVEYFCEGDFLDQRAKEEVYPCSERCEEGRCSGEDKEVPRSLSFWERLRRILE
mgnify:CR=1 FL=1